MTVGNRPAPLYQMMEGAYGRRSRRLKRLDYRTEQGGIDLYWMPLLKMPHLYVYYHEHCICFNRERAPAQIHRACFGRLLDVICRFPHYFVGSNTGLPLVGALSRPMTIFGAGAIPPLWNGRKLGHLLRFPGLKM